MAVQQAFCPVLFRTFPVAVGARFHRQQMKLKVYENSEQTETIGPASFALLARRLNHPHQLQTDCVLRECDPTATALQKLCEDHLPSPTEPGWKQNRKTRLPTSVSHFGVLSPAVRSRA